MKAKLLEELKIKRNKKIAFVIGGVLLLSLVGGLAAKYVTERKYEAEMLSSDFHISSNYLQEVDEDAAYTVSDWGEHGIEILLFNYEKENVTSISGTDMKYKVEVPANWDVTVTDDIANSIAVDGNGDYTFEKSDVKASHKLLLSYTGTGEPSETILVIVTTTNPYKKTLAATFTLEGKRGAEYKVEDNGDYCVVTIYTNDYAGDMKVTWDDAFAPDNTNPLMKNWKTDTTDDYLMDLEANTTYELIFVEHESTNGEQTLTSVGNNMIHIEAGN